jgi:nitrogen-specific signal transduction histidine kinase
MAAAQEGARRAADLVQRLLAFSRQLPMNPHNVDVTAMVESMSELMRRTLREQVHLASVIAEGLWKARADISQLENAILNLSINARDAMPNGGRLTIEASNTELTIRTRPNMAMSLPANTSDRRFRHRHRHASRNHRTSLRALLHDQGCRQGNRPRPEPGFRLHQAVAPAI